MSNLHRFYHNAALVEHETITLDDASAKHVWQVLRMEAGDRIEITDGLGNLAIAVLSIAEKHRCEARIETVKYIPRPKHALHLCVAFTKNNSRNEWLLEKATELGATSITPMASVRSEKVHFRHDRWEKLLISAMLQSKQTHLPKVSETTPLTTLLKKYADVPHKYIAHCISETPRTPIVSLMQPSTEMVVLIGPEGDFRFDEVSVCMETGFKPVSLGNTRLRTETAAIAVCAHYNLINDGKE